MKLQKKLVLAGILFLACFGIHWYSINEIRVENGYCAGFSPFFTGFLRNLFGKLPISIGDIFYGVLVAWLLWTASRFFLNIFKKGRVPSRRRYLLDAGLNSFVFCCSIYIIFNVFWGINYDRKGIAWQLGLEMGTYSKEDLVEINCLLADKINKSKRILVNNQLKYPSDEQLFSMTSEAYRSISGRYKFLQYRHSSIKSSLWGWLGNYTGFTGYYNPFTGEAQLNTTVPKFLQPFVACHEVAHQLGYAKEMEANFVGYLAASSSKDTLFQYSVYLDLFTYANRNLHVMDSVSAKLCRMELDTTVVSDIKEWIEFNKKHKSFVEPVVRWIYGKYLQGNSQPQGILSYDEVTAFIIAYYKKFGTI